MGRTYAPGVMRPYHVEAQEAAQINGVLVWAEDAWDALSLAKRNGLKGTPFRAPVLEPDRIFEFSIEERKA